MKTMGRKLKVICAFALVAVLVFGCAKGGGSSKLAQVQLDDSVREGPAPDGFVWIPAGIFTMGSPKTEPERIDFEIQHDIALTKGFYMGKYLVTQGQYKAVMEANPSYFVNAPNGGNADNLPVEQVSWYDAIVFCNKLSIKEGLTPAYRIDGSTDPAMWGSVPTDSDAIWDGTIAIVEDSTGYRLPTEAQWEYACRAGTTTAFNWGTDTINDTQANYDASKTNSMNLTAGLYRERTTEVGSFAPNDWGLYDMHGNVGEWCWDWIADYSKGGNINPRGVTSGVWRVLRGGAWFYENSFVRSAARGLDYPYSRSSYHGFRLVCP